MNRMTGEVPDLTELYDADTAVQFPNGTSMSLGQMVAAEALLCEADPARQRDPVRRAHFVALKLEAAGTLRDEHRHLLDRPPE